MPQAAAHIIIAFLIASFIREILKKKGVNISSKYIFIVGISGILPDVDVIAFWILHFLGFTLSEVHRTFTHTLFFPIVFIIAGFIFNITLKNKGLKKELRLDYIMFAISIGIFVHIILDFFIAGHIMPFYPFSSLKLGINLFGYLPYELAVIASPCLDAAVLILWIIYLEKKHKLSKILG